MFSREGDYTSVRISRQGLFGAILKAAYFTFIILFLKNEHQSRKKCLRTYVWALFSKKKFKCLINILKLYAPSSNKRNTV